MTKSITLVANDPNGQSLELRVVKQPQHGTVGLAGTLATYRPQAGYIGPDAFTFAAFDGTEDSNLATVSLQVTTASCAGSAVPYGFGCPGEMGLLPVLTAQGCPEAGALLTLTANGGVPGGTALLVFGATQGTAMLPEGCVLRVEPLLPGIIPLPVNGLGEATVSAVLPLSLSGIDFTAQMFLLGSQPGAVGRGATNGLAISVP
ncbi:MAG: hypothetical protein ACI9EF_002080 [Pseudohongiellaceae bacterium]